MMKVYINMDAKKGLEIGGEFSPTILRVLITIVASLASLPWLEQIGHTLGWL